jgi:hypothetical protein
MLVRTIARRSQPMHALICLALLLAVLGLVARALPAEAQEVEVKTASAICLGGSNRYDDVRFNLSAPATVGVQFDTDGNWWLRQEPAGPMLAQVLKGEATIPSGASTGGGTLRQLSVALPAGTFILHCDCSGASRDRSGAAILTVPASPPTPEGPTYLVTARADADPVTQAGWVHGYNDRVFVLTSRQVVSFGSYGGPSTSNATKSTGWIADANGTTWWAIDAGTIRSRSTLDLQPGIYCLHTDYAKDMPVAFSDQWTLQFVGPTQPAGAQTTVTALYNPNPTGNESKYEDAAFILAQPQVVTLGADAATASGWIVDSTGLVWYRMSNGVTQSTSSWAGPGGGKTPGKAQGVEGVMLAAGTYLVHADAGGAGTGKIRVNVTFAGTSTAAFPWPSPMRDACYQSAQGGQAPAAGGSTAGGSDEETVKCKWSDVPCQLEVARRTIEKRLQGIIERMIAEWIQEICATSYVAPITLVGVVLLARPWCRKRDGP